MCHEHLNSTLQIYVYVSIYMSQTSSSPNKEERSPHKSREAPVVALDGEDPHAFINKLIIERCANGFVKGQLQ